MFQRFLAFENQSMEKVDQTCVGVLILDSGSWILGAWNCVSCFLNLDLGVWIFEFGFWILHFG